MKKEIFESKIKSEREEATSQNDDGMMTRSAKGLQRWKIEGDGFERGHELETRVIAQILARFEGWCMIIFVQILDSLGVDSGQVWTGIAVWYSREMMQVLEWFLYRF
ncbi:unnamed protein product [Vicia faba]|uniref:Uncharacterized protein n=1 Tax=Vicia faba TaxID=3906 RepID=A0AAV0YZ45_VICFA|nr:unnamed protein product [Vicia faba]